MEFKKENYKGCVVVQGKTYPECLPTIKERWHGYCIIFSTWMGDEQYYNNDDIVIYNEIPKNAGVSNLNLQKITTWNGLALAKKMGWDSALKWRSDMYPNNADFVWDMFSDGVLNFLCWCTTNGGFVTDYFVYGKCDDIISIYNIDRFDVGFPEQHITYKLKELGLDKTAACMGDKLGEFGDIYWHKNELWLSTYKGIDVYQFEIPKF